jgi:tetraacyldisaccharide 4'-kinase
VVTTAKDAVRLPPDQRQQVDVVGVEVAWDDPVAVESRLGAALAATRCDG